MRDQEIQYNRSGLSPVTHERQLSVVTYVPPNPYQSKGGRGGGRGGGESDTMEDSDDCMSVQGDKKEFVSLNFK